MVRPKEKELTQRELEVMHVFWKYGELTAIQARDHLENDGLKRAYPTIANLVRVLYEKKLLTQLTEERPFRYAPAKSHDDVANGLVRDLVDRVFFGSREKFLVGMLGSKKLTAKERSALEKLLKDSK